MFGKQWWYNFDFINIFVRLYDKWGLAGSFWIRGWMTWWDDSELYQALHPEVIHNHRMSKNESQNHTLRLWLVQLVYQINSKQCFSNNCGVQALRACASPSGSPPQLFEKTFFGIDTLYTSGTNHNHSGWFWDSFFDTPGLWMTLGCIKMLGTILDHPIRSFNLWFKANPLSLICNKVQRYIHISLL